MEKNYFILILLLFFLSASSHSSLIASYSFDGNANDSVHGLNGTVVGATLTQDRFGVASKAYYFDGNDYISLGNPSLLNFTTDFSITAWIKPMTNSETWPSVISKWTGNTHLETFWLGYYQNAANYYLGAEVTNAGYNNYRNTTNTTITLGQWQQIGVSYSASSHWMGLYLNGTLVEQWLDLLGTNIWNSSDPVVIGGVMKTSLNHAFVGSIDEIQIYDHSFAIPEMSSLLFLLIGLIALWRIAR